MILHSLKGNHTEGKQLFLRFLIGTYWNSNTRRVKHPRRLYYRVALMRSRGDSIDKIMRINRISKKNTKNRIREIEQAMTAFSKMTRIYPIKIGAQNEQRI